MDQVSNVSEARWLVQCLKGTKLSLFRVFYFYRLSNIAVLDTEDDPSSILSGIRHWKVITDYEWRRLKRLNFTPIVPTFLTVMNCWGFPLPLFIFSARISTGIKTGMLMILG